MSTRLAHIGLMLVACAAVLSACATGSPTPQTPPTPARSVTPTPGNTGMPPATLVPPDSQQPTAGICGQAEGNLATVEIRPDVPSPRCLKVTPTQRLHVINDTPEKVTVSLGIYSLDLEPGAEGTLDTPLGAFLAPGVHRVFTSKYSGPEIWLIEGPATPRPAAP